MMHTCIISAWFSQPSPFDAAIVYMTTLGFDAEMWYRRFCISTSSGDS